MKVTCVFVGGSDKLREKVQKSCDTAAEIIVSDAFLDRVKAHGFFTSTDMKPEEIAAMIGVKGRKVTVKVGFYRNIFSRAIAYESNGAIYLNTCKAAAGSPGNMAHELMHVLGFSHNGNKALVNQNSVPYRVGEWVEEMLP